MNLRRKVERNLLRRAQKDGGITEHRLFPITPVAGVPAGFLMGTVSPGPLMGQWDVITHPDLKEYTVREKGCNETTGKVVRLTEAWVAFTVMKANRPIADVRQLPPNQVFINVAAKGTTYVLPIQELVLAVLEAPAPAAPEPASEEIPDGPQG